MRRYDKKMDASVVQPLPMAPPKNSHRTRPRRSKEHDFPSTSARELVRLLIYEEREAQDLQKVLLNLTEQLKAEKRRADEAELRAKETATHFKALNDARVSSLQETAKLNEELKLYKAQLETAQKEIFRAQDVLQAVDAQRHSAELDAAKSRTTARKFQHERAVERAKEEGRRLGFEEGVERGKLIAFQQTRYGSSTEGLYPEEIEVENGTLAPDDYYEQSNTPPETVPVQDSDTGTLVTPTPRPAQEHTPPIVPIVVHNVAPTPRHAPVSMPPDGFIPATGNDSVIRLPPPHELAPPPPTPRRSPSPPLPPIPQDEEPALMIPEPNLSSRRSSTATPRAARSQYSPESNSTTISQFDIVSTPAQYALRNVRGSPLSVIPEVLSAHASPYREPSVNGSSSKLPTATPSQHANGILEDGAHRQGQYQRPRESSDSSDSSDMLQSLNDKRQVERRGSHSTGSSVPGITVQPPSRPQSNTSGRTLGNSSSAPFGEFLSPADADRPMPLPTVSAVTPSRVPLPTTSSTAPIILPSDELPLGFVPCGDGFTPGPGTGSALNQILPSGSPMPGEFSASSDVYVNEPGHRLPEVKRVAPSSDVVIPIPSSAMYGPTDSDDEVSSSLSSLDTLTTPLPNRGRKPHAERKRSSPSVGSSGFGYMYAPMGAGSGTSKAGSGMGKDAKS